MAQNKKRPEYVLNIMSDVNTYLRNKNVKDESDSLFVWACGYLIGRNMYNGFNYFKYGKTLANPIMLAGSSNKDEFDFLQIL